MSLKDSLQKKLETQTEAWREQVDKLKQDAETRKAEAKDEQAEAEIQKQFSEKIQALESNIDAATSKLADIREAGEDRLSDMKDQIDSWLSGSNDKTGQSSSNDQTSQ
ncbi:hypothetical protein GCM10011533_06280 [Streptosporangium jomthongense]|uniref:Coiled coil domain-containing protein n=1 Tax=Marinobacter aromaticivorans TaxID=1494078 RepID=A0ABW2IRY8_9GAMM|nr:hypothetical protein [Marinobacter aromaticivorans]GGE56538.1 hypothetical protein GCM10011533_06280 [Streptosporangium jomthongense]